MVKKKKSTKPGIKIIILFALIQALLIFNAIETIFSVKPTSISECEKTTITVEEKFSRGGATKSTPGYYIVYNDVEYILPGARVYRELEVGQKLEILYFKHKYHFKTKYRVVDVRDGENVIYSFDDYTYDFKLGKITLAVLAPIIQLFFLAIWGIMLFLYLKIYRKGNNKKKRKKKRKLKQQKIISTENSNDYKL